MPDSYKELIKSNPDETEIRSFLVDGDQVSVTLRIPDTLRDAAKEEAALRGIATTMSRSSAGAWRARMALSLRSSWRVSSAVAWALWVVGVP